MILLLLSCFIKKMSIPFAVPAAIGAFLPFRGLTCFKYREFSLRRKKKNDKNIIIFRHFYILPTFLSSFFEKVKSPPVKMAI